MAIQYQDDSFSETLPFDKIMKRFNQEIEKDQEFVIKALHFGTPKEIEEEKEKQDLKKRIDQIEKKILELSPIKTTLKIPTPKEITNSILSKT